MRFALHWRPFALTAALSFATLLAACSLAGDVTPPPGFPTPPLVPATSAATAPPIVEPLLPEQRPVALNGGVVYQEHCAACHGPRGNGGGSMTSQLPAPPPNFADPALLRQRTPQELFITVTQGRLDKFMPPFAGSLTVAERWNAVAYLYTLSQPPEQMAAGEAVYTAHCAACHGPQGQGDGPESAAQDRPPTDLSNHEYAAIRTAADYLAALAASPVHAEAAALSEADRWAAVDFARTLAYDFSPAEAVLAEGQGHVRGQLVNGTAGAPVPTGVAVTLHGFEANTLLTTLTTTVDAAGGFAFDAVAFAPGVQFMASAEYQGLTYSSAPASFPPAVDADAPTLELSLPVYETTTDTSVLAVPQVHMFLEFNDPRTLTVGELFVFSNSSDRTLAALAGQPLAFTLPPGAAGLNVQGGQLDETYFLTEQGFSLVWSVPPGDEASQILFSYQLAYDGGLSFAQPLDYPVANVNLLVSDLALTVSGPGVANLGPQDFQGQQFQNYSVGPLAAGDSLSFAVAGQPGTSPGGAPVPAPSRLTDTSNLAVGLGALALALLGIGFWLFRRRPPAASATRDELLQALAELDDAYAARTLAEAAYHRERARLKEALKRQWS